MRIGKNCFKFFDRLALTAACAIFLSGSAAAAGHMTKPPACDAIAMPSGVTALRNTVLAIPITTSDVSGQGVISFDTTITFDPAVLTYIGFDQSGTVSQGMAITINSNNAGTLVISGFSATAAAGSGVLLNLNFFTAGPVGTTSAMTFSSFVYNEGTPCTTTTNGDVTIISGTITGVVSYANAPIFRPVPRTVLTAAGSVVATANSALFTGAYTLNGMGPGAYTVMPSNTTDINGITGFDSALIAQHVVNLTTLNPTQLAAADVSQNGQVTSFDAAEIAQWIALIPNPGVTGTWRFSPASRSYTDVETNQSNQDYTAILMGEVSGNWAAPTSRPSEALEAQLNAPTAQLPVTVTAPTKSAITGFDFDVPVTVTPLPPPAGTFTGVFSYQFDLIYDPSVINPTASPIDLTGSASAGSFPTSNVPSPGLLKVVVFRASPPMTGTGLLLTLKFHASGAPGTFTNLSLSNYMFNEGDPPNIPVDGLVTIVGPTAAAVSVSGRAVTAAGSGIRNARLELRSSDGNVMTTVSNAFGYYHFDSVASGGGYFLTADARGYQFAPRALMVVDSVANEDVVADP
jgi:hypothetical protein